MGDDWKGYFDYLNEFCKVEYLPRTQGISSTQLRQNRKSINIGIVGSGSIARRFVKEIQFVNNISVSGVFNPFFNEVKEFVEEFHITNLGSFEDLISVSDAIYIASPFYTHYEYCEKALSQGKNVLCETPFVLKEEEAKYLFELAQKNNVKLMIALKTAYCPAFNHLYALLKSGVIGEIIEINTSSTTLMEEESYLSGNRYGGSMIENGSFTLLPILKFFGPKFLNINFYSRQKNDIDIFTKAVIRFKHSVASFQVGLGVKTEGNLIISGTKGYAYVPAPWWKTDFFEIRYEDPKDNKKYFYPFLGDGLRYEIKDFVSAIITDLNDYKLTKEEIICMAKIQELFNDQKNLYLI